MSQYLNGEYLEKNPTWDVEDSPWKARKIVELLQRNSISPERIAEIGCGAGEVLHQLYQAFPESCIFEGYEISPQALDLCRIRANDRLKYYLDDFLEKDFDSPYDLILALDVIEHVEDYFGFLKRLRCKAEYKIFHIPLDLSVISALLMTPILNARNKVGHLHYFSKETALAVLADTGYQIIDYYYTSGPLDRPPRTMSGRSRFADYLKSRVYLFSPDSWVRILGGSMIVLAK